MRPDMLIVFLLSVFFHVVSSKRLVDLAEFVTSFITILLMYGVLKWVLLLPAAGSSYPIPETVNQWPATIVATVVMTGICMVLWKKKNCPA